MYRPQKKTSYRHGRLTGPKRVLARKRMPIEPAPEPPKQNVADLFKLKSAGAWSQELLTSHGFGKLLEEQHLAEVKKILGRIKPKNETQLKKALLEAQNTPQQRFLILNEASMQGPLKPEAFQEYFTLFKTILPAQYKQMYGAKTPAQLTEACKRDWRRRK